MHHTGNLLKFSAADAKVFFLTKRIRVKFKNLMNHWVAKGIAKSSKKEKRLYEKYLKKSTLENKKIYRNYKSLFDSIKKKSKKLYYFEQLLKLQKNAKQECKVMKETIGKAKLHTSHFPKKLPVNKINLFDKADIANELNKFFANIGIELASQIPISKTAFETYVETVNSTIDSNPHSINELKDAIISLKISKSLGYDEVRFNVVKKCFDELYDRINFIFELSLENGIFLDDLKISRVTHVFKGEDRSKLRHYSPISMLPYFSKILERIMYNPIYPIYKYLLENKILYPKQLRFHLAN